jgi:transcription elongation factor SPT5
MSRNLIDQDFGSDEEDDDFNPAPAEDSDNEEVNRGQVRITLDNHEKTGLTRRYKAGRRGRDDNARNRDDDEDGENEAGGDEDEEDDDERGEEEEEEEEADEDEEDEDAVSVGLHSYSVLSDDC